MCIPEEVAVQAEIDHQAGGDDAQGHEYEGSPELLAADAGAVGATPAPPAPSAPPTPQEEPENDAEPDTMPFMEGAEEAPELLGDVAGVKGESVMPVVRKRKALKGAPDSAATFSAM